jgi:hypothetical protein
MTGRNAPRDAAVFGAVAAVGLLAALVFAGVGVHELSYASDRPHAYGPAKVTACGAGAGALLPFAGAGLAWSLLRSTR